MVVLLVALNRVSLDKPKHKQRKRLMDVTQYIEDNRMYFWSTIDREETEFEVDMGQVPTKGKIECIIMTGPRRGETIMHRWLSLNTLWEQQQEEEENE
mgnify:CR=1 FL=1|jgi:hypothetical protein|tara:strand:- start:54 stop:347 length:294 start_codon:yes stop_codon:yes gene_type:complete